MHRIVLDAQWPKKAQARPQAGFRAKIYFRSKKTEEELFWYFLYTDASLDADASIISAFLR